MRLPWVTKKFNYYRFVGIEGQKTVFWAFGQSVDQDMIGPRQQGSVWVYVVSQPHTDEKWKSQSTNY